MGDNISNFHGTYIMSNVPYFKTIIAVASATVTYTGWAAPGSATSEAKWFIMKEETASSVTTVSFANGKRELDQVWDDRASLAYN